MSSRFFAPAVTSCDEVEIFALIHFIWHQKKIVLLIAAVVCALSAVYAFFATPEYSVNSVLRPVAINELDALNRSEIYKLPPKEALLRVRASIGSYETRLNFFKKNQELFESFVRPGRTMEQSFEEFDRNSIDYIVSDSDKLNALGANIKLQLSYPEGVDGVSILNGFVSYAIEVERQRIASDMSVIVKNRLNEIQGKLAAAKANYDDEKQAKIASLFESDSLKRAKLQDELKALRAQLKNLRTYRISQLDEAIGIARALGINKPSTPSSLGDSQYSGSRVMRTEINNQQIPLYFMGVEALAAEKAALQRRTSDDFADGRIAEISKELQLLRSNREVEVMSNRLNEELFWSGVQPLYAESARLQSLNLDMSQLRLVNIDKYALEPLGPTKPKKFLVIFLGLMAGLALGVTIASVNYFFKLTYGSPSDRLRLANLPVASDGTPFADK